MNELYHGTLARNLPAIRKAGLLAQKGSWTVDFHSEAAELVYAVDESRRGRVIVAITGQMAKSGLVQWSENYQFDHFNADLTKHGAVVVVSAVSFSSYSAQFEQGHPPGAEPGDWYSRQSVSLNDIQRIMIGHEMLDWLKPDEMDFAYRFRDILRNRCRGNSQEVRASQ